MSINRITAEDVAALRRHLDESMSGRPNAFNIYQTIATKSAIYPGQGTPIGLDYVALKGCGEAGEFAEHVGKAMRDDRLINVVDGAVSFEPLTPERHAALVKEIGDQLWYLAAKCNELNITLAQAALVNIEKLFDRTSRDTLRGSGDER